MLNFLILNEKLALTDCLFLEWDGSRSNAKLFLSDFLTNFLGKRSLPPGSAGVSPAEMADKMSSLPGKGRGE